MQESWAPHPTHFGIGPLKVHSISSHSGHWVVHSLGSPPQASQRISSQDSHLTLCLSIHATHSKESHSPHFSMQSTQIPSSLQDEHVVTVRERSPIFSHRRLLQETHCVVHFSGKSLHSLQRILLQDEHLICTHFVHKKVSHWPQLRTHRRHCSSSH